MRQSEIVENEYLKNPIPVSDKYNQDLDNLGSFVWFIENNLSAKNLKKINVRRLVDSGKLFATQSWLTSYGGGDPVFNELHEPVIYEHNGVGYIIDGHHRLAQAYIGNKPAVVHWFKKSIEESVLDEGRNDPHIFKAIFLFGGPGSGKSYVGRKLVNGTGVKYTNLDTFFEYFAKQADIDPSNLIDIDPTAHKRAGELTSRQQQLYAKQRLGLLIDGTGRKLERIVTMKRFLEDLGYSTMGIFINTDIETALHRNFSRERKVDAVFLKQAHEAVRNNLGALQAEFNSNFVIIDNSKDNPDLSVVWKKVRTFINGPLTFKAKKWIGSE